ncbi:PREDICTED: homeobox-DDT domain protein RLT2-like [Nicotiana attenuata]|uniref:Homeobox-ddt domain protein rlt2 n=1 Tax=Nicotiana attenuata TaxID=49451 RepID=A0A314KQP3_NICAT|nr:PREDICTED: homeobox-DDT domain protein RLT2-like [Nicotiana attenuata]OIT31129.1 homeobox-ddt domain protein rlt2 [Nicotiana attenuata]
MELDSSAAAAATATGGGSGSSDVEKKKLPEGGEPKVKRKMKTASQLEILENTYAVETYPSEALRAELSVKLGLSDRQLQMWFCHRRLKDRKATTPVKRQKKEASPVAMVDEMAVSGEIGKEHAFGSGSRVSPLGLVDLQLQQQHHQQRVAHRPGTAVPRFRTEMQALKRYYEPPQAISELRAIAFVEAQLGQPLREDGPILGMEFDPLPPGAFGAPIVAAMQHKPVGRPFEAQIYEKPDVNSIKGTTRTLHEYQFLPEQPSIRSNAYEQSVPSPYYSSIEVQSSRTMLSTGRSFMHGSEQVASGYSIPGQIPTLNLLPQGKQGHISPASAEADAVPQRSLVNIEVEANYGGQPMTALESPFMARVIHDEERLERKRKSEEARIAREVEAHEKRIRKELEKQDMLRRKREEQIRKDMERQDRERRKEEERLLREKLREEERYQREQKREMERREKFLQKESIKAEKMRLKEEMRREKEVARLKAANVRATARRIAKESTELIDDERLELMELAASKKGLPSILSLDSENLQNLEAFRDMLIEFPPKSVCLRKPFGVEPWICSEEDVGNILMVWRFLITFSDVLRLWPFTLDEFVQAFHDFDPRLLAEIHIALLKLIIKDIEDVARTPASAVGANPNSGANPGGGHPEIVEGAYAWGFDIRSWQSHLNALTWPEILRQFALCAGFGPKLKKQSVGPAYPRDENEGNDGADIISNLRSGVAAEKAVAKLQERGFSNPRRSRHRLTPGTVKFAAFHILSLEGSKGLNILEVAEKIQKSGLRDLTTSKTPEASISAALSRDTKLFERTAPSTYCLRDPYRKDPADADAILSAAREKIRVFKNECVNGEEAEDVEKEVERDDESESDAADDPEVDDLVSELKFVETPQSHKTDRTDGTNSTEDVSEILRFDLTQTPGDVSLQNSTGIMHSESFGELKPIGTSGSQSAAIGADSSNLNQEDAVIDESNAGQKWVQGLTEGEYSDLTVEERLDALVALIGVANEGNSIRLVLEERLEAASALKKQIWAEAQLDKRRFKEEFLLKVQYPSVSNNAEQFCSVTSREARQSPLLAVDGHNEVAAIRSLQQEAMHKLPDESNNSSNVAVEKACPMQEIYGDQDNSQFQHFAYVAEKSRSQLKAYIGHRAEETFVYRSLPLGQDRRRNRYWQFITSPSRNDPGSGRIFVELRDGRWRLIDSEKDFNALMASLDVRGIRESHLHSMLQNIEATFKETSRRYLCTEAKVANPVKADTSETVPSNDCCSKTGSPKSTICISNCETPEPSTSFLIGIGRNKMENSDALSRYAHLEKWMWEDCVNTQFLCARKYGKIRCEKLISICNNCHDTYFLEDNHCHCCHTTFSLAKTSCFMEHVAQCKDKLEDLFRPLISDSAPPLRIRLLRAQLASMEACIPPEALEPVWSEVYRRSWGLKLHIASAAGDLLQILTLLEGAIKREYLMLDYETTTELLGAVSNSNLDRMAVLPWVPHTTAAVALRLMELDSSLCYTQQQKADSLKERESANSITLKTNYADMKRVAGIISAEAPLEYENLEPDFSVKVGGRHVNSGQGRNHVRGGAHSRVGGGRSQRKLSASKSESAQRTSTKNSGRFDHLPAWQSRDRGKARRKRGRRSVRNRQKPVKNVENAAIEKVTIPIQQKWKEDEETAAAQFEAPDNDSDPGTSGSEDDNGQATADDYEDLIADNYGVLRDKTDHASNIVKYSVGEHYIEPADGDDVDDYEDDRDEEDEEEGLADENVQRYFDAESEEEGNRFMDAELVENPNKDSESSSEYSD